MPQKESPLHESIAALMAESLEGETPEATIRRKAREIVAKHRHLWTGPPFCPIALAELEGIVVEAATSDILGDGCIFPKGKKVFIQYAPDRCQERIRFTVCHELAHTLFPDCYRRERRRTQSERAQREFERLCDLGASEFLFPLENFSADIGSRPLTGEDLLRIATLYGASVDATCWRIVHLANYPVCAVFGQFKKLKGREKEQLVVQYSVPHPKFPYNLHPNLLINSKSSAHVALKEEGPSRAQRENWKVQGNWARLRVEAVPLPKFAVKETADVALLVYPA